MLTPEGVRLLLRGRSHLHRDLSNVLHHLSFLPTLTHNLSRPLSTLYPTSHPGSAEPHPDRRAGLQPAGRPGRAGQPGQLQPPGGGQRRQPGRKHAAAPFRTGARSSNSTPSRPARGGGRPSASGWEHAGPSLAVDGSTGPMGQGPPL